MPRCARVSRWSVGESLRSLRRASALIVPIPAAEPVVAVHRDRHDRSARLGMPAHVTLLYPFLPAGRIDHSVVASLHDVFARRAPFRFELTRVESFPGVLFLAPEPAEPFADITRALVDAWPRCPPYDGIHTDVVPHLTVAQDTLPDRLAMHLARRLPVATEAGEAWLMTPGVTGHWSLRARFTFGMRTGAGDDARDRTASLRDAGSRPRSQ